MTLAMVFPGQGSQSPGMQADLAAEYSLVQETYAAASETLGYDLWQLVQDGPAEKLAETVITQPAMLAAGYATWLVWQESGGTSPSHMAGHSLGEYTALVCAGAVSFGDALTVVKKRSELMQAAVPVGVGAMAAIIGLDDDAIRAACESAAEIGVAEAVNFNSPGQVVIAGHKEAVDHAIVQAEEAGARRAILLPVSVPSHCSLMQPAAEALAGRLEESNFETPKMPVLHNADVLEHWDAASIRKALVQQLCSPVRWVETVQAMAARGAGRVVELGAGRVLAGLSRRIDRDLECQSVNDPASLEQALAT